MAANPEALLISAMIRQGDHITPAARGITGKFFHSYPDEWAWIEKYIATHKRAPSKGAFKNKFPEFRFRKVDDVDEFCEEVRRSHVHTETTAAIQEIIGKLEVGAIDQAVKMMHSNALRIETQMAGMSGDADVIEHFDDVVDEAMRRVARAQEFGIAGLPTGFPTLDERLGGFQPGWVVIFAARLGQGKSWSLVRMACAAAFSGFNVQYDSLEQSRAEIAMRVHTFASSEYGKQTFRNTDLAQGKNFSPREYKEFLRGLKEDVKGKLHIADNSRGIITPLTIAAQIERNKPDGIFLDYLTLMENSTDDWRGVAKISGALKQIAQQYQVPIIAAAQLNRMAAAGKDLPGTETLAESDNIGRDADAVITARQLSKHVIAFKLAKFRHGRDGYTFYCKFLPNTGHFEEIPFDDAQDVIADDRDKDAEGDDFKFKPRQKGSFKSMQDRRTEFNKGALMSGEHKKRRREEKKSGPSRNTKKRVVVKRRSK